MCQTPLASYVTIYSVTKHVEVFKLLSFALLTAPFEGGFARPRIELIASDGKRYRLDQEVKK